MTQLLAHRYLTRTRTAVAQRIAPEFYPWGRASVTCEICPRYVRPHLLTDRGWCPECEREFVKVVASLRRMGIVPGAT